MAIPIPRVIQQSLDIIGGLAPPMALLLIGASLSMQLMRKHLRPTLGGNHTQIDTKRHHFC